MTKFIAFKINTDPFLIQGIFDIIQIKIIYLYILITKTLLLT